MGTGLAICILFIVLYGFGEIGRPVLYLLTDNYQGWVGIRFADPKCPPLSHEGW
jgi:hypothetical protein